MRDEIVRMCGLLCKGVLPNHCQMMVAEREVDKTTRSAHRRPSSPYRYEGGRTSSPQKRTFDVLCVISICQNRLAMWPAGKRIIRVLECQCKVE